jgi:RES domain
MTMLFRCSGGHHFNTPARESFKFLDNVVERATISTYLSFPNPVLEVFKRGPIPPQFQTRFGPPGHTRNPLYVASDIDTTFYEYGFHLLASQAFDGEELKITCFELDCNLTGNISNPANDPNSARILGTSTNYSAAHSWLKTMNPGPDIVEYPSVRHPSATPPASGMNYAIYNQINIIGITNQSQQLIRVNQAQGSITVYDTLSSWMTTLIPRVT